MRKRGWVAIAGLACALLCAWGAAAFLRETAGDERGGGDATSKAAAAAAASDDRRPVAGAGEADAPRDDSSAHEFNPTVVAVDPRLEWPDAATLRRIAQRGRTLFGGIVYAPDGSPCSGATVSCNGTAIATSDDHGAWRADVGRSPYYDFDVDVGFNWQVPSTYLLAAQKDGVGFAEEGVGAASRRVDLHLRGGFSFRGTVIDNDDLRPVAGAELEAHVRSLVERVRADERGDFAFENLPGGNLDLSGRASGYDSNGSFSYNFDRGRDVTITFRLTKAYRLRGQFAPWPPPEVSAASAAVVVSPRSPHGGSSAPTLKGAIGNDGSFDVTLPVCPECRVELVCEDGTIWQTDLDVNEEKHDVDLGRIEFARTAAVTGRVEIADEGLRSAIVAAASVMLEGGRPATVGRKVAADGSFRLAPLPAGTCTFTLALDNHRLASLRMASGASSEERNADWIELAPGETRDLGVIALEGVILFGRVRDGRGEPIALAQIRQLLGRRDLPSRIRNFILIASDEEGSYRSELVTGDDDKSPAQVEVRARGFAPIRVDVECPARDAIIRRDFVLSDGVILRGTLQDESGAPLSDWAIRATPADPPDGRADDRTGFDATQADGSFEIRGLTAGEWNVRALDHGGTMLEFKRIHPERGPVTLRTADGVPVSTPSIPR